MHAQGIVSKLHISIFKVFCYQKLPTHIWSILLTCKFLLFHSHLSIHICTFESPSHVTHTLAFEKEFSCHLSTLERQLHIIYSFREAFKRAYIHKVLDHLFNIYTSYLKGPFSSYLSYTYTFMVNNIFT